MSLTLGIRQVGPLCATDGHKCVSTEQTQIPANRMSGRDRRHSWSGLLPDDGWWRLRPNVTA